MHMKQYGRQPRHVHFDDGRGYVNGVGKAKNARRYSKRTFQDARRKGERYHMVKPGKRDMGSR